TGVGVELMLQTIGSNSAAELRLVRIPERRRIVVGGRTKDRGTDIHDLSPGVVGLEGQSTSGTLGQRDVRCVVASGSEIHPRVGRADKRIRAPADRDVLRSLRDSHLETGGTNSAAEASRRVVADHRTDRIVIDRSGEVIRLVTNVADLYRHVRGNRPLDLQSPLLDRWSVHVRVETADR